MSKKFSTRLRRQKHFRQKTLSNLALFLVVLVPIYPVFGSYMQSYTGVVVRGEYDRSTILASYDWETGENTSDFIQDLVQEAPETTLLEPETDPVLTPPQPEVTQPVAQPVDPKRWLYVTHTVVRGDTISTIAQKYGIPIATLRSMNNLNSDILSINQKVVIPRINGAQYAIQKWDTLSTIAQKYGIKDINTILIANDMSRNTTLSVGKKLLLPNPTKDPTKKPAPQIAKSTPVAPKNTPEKNGWNTSPKPAAPQQKIIQTPKDQDNITYGDYSLSLKVNKWCRNFVWGNCTCFVAKYKNVSWRGNAKDWIRNAKKQWKPTGNDARPGAIIVYHGPWFPPAYGHVGIVMAVNDDHMIIKDMNYRALNEVTTRRETFNNPAIIGYIYVD